MKNTITEIKNTLEGINSKIPEAEKWINDWEEKVVDSLLWNRIKKKE